MARKILLADDSVTAQNMGRKILADAGYEVITVNNGSAALKKVNEVKPDVIVLDVYMPGYSGLEVCQRLKEVNETARIPILLTVGKLEPFKPEEAKRARADAFIVKPFEASELLSALSKLEDKIVPRPEPHKPGRFARAIAAVEEGRYDRSMAVEEDDTGWKRRIAFPSKKKAKAEEEKEYVDDPGFYNAVNKDLRTTVEHAPAPQAEPAKEGPRVDLGAMAGHGLPKDVTPEEIAALAAAAAQIQRTVGEKQEPEKAAETARAGEPAAEQPAEERVAAAPAVGEAAAQPVAAQTEASTEATPEAKQETPAVEIAKEATAPPVEEVAQPVAEKKEENLEAADKTSEAVVASKTPDLTSSIAADMTLAITALPLGTYVSLTPASGNGSSSHAEESEPMTMAAAAGAEFTSPASRWMAVPVALLPEEAALSLDLEMQKTSAALAAAEVATAAAAAVVENQPAAVAELPAETPVAEPAAPTFLSEVADTVSSVASKAAEVIKAAVREFETVAAPKAEQVEAQPAAPAEPEPVAAQKAEQAAEAAVEDPVAAEAKAEEKPVVESVAAEPEAAVAQSESAPVTEETKAEPQEQTAETKPEESQPALEAFEPAAAEISSSVQEAETAAPVKAETSELETSEAPAPVATSEIAAEPAAADGVSAQTTTEISEQAQPSSGGTDEMAKKEREIAATTAAAWASWRRIRETGSPKAQASAEPAEKEAEEEAVAPLEKDESAMAVAAGAEKAPAEVSEDGESAEIASIVDSVLADMRPKIVEEISRKLKKKK